MENSDLVEQEISENIYLYNQEILENFNKETRIKLSLEIQNKKKIIYHYDNEGNVYEICLIDFPKLQSSKNSTLYENIIQFLNDNYYETILKKTNLKWFVPYDEPKYMFDIKSNIINITYQHDMRKYNILENYNINIIEYSLYDNYFMDYPFE